MTKSLVCIPVLVIILVPMSWLLSLTLDKIDKSVSESQCETGLILTRQRFQRSCQDFDECIEYQGLCQGNLHCTNTVGRYVCGCRSGFQAVGTDCIDINECENQNQCPDKALCVNTEGNVTCQCFEGYQGELCEDINECHSNQDNCDKNADCQNSGLVVTYNLCELPVVFLCELLNYNVILSENGPLKNYLV